MDTINSVSTPPFTPILASTRPKIRKQKYSIARLGGDGSTRFLRDIYRNNFPHLRQIPTDDELDIRTEELMYRAKDCEKYHKYRQDRPQQANHQQATKVEKKWPQKLEYGFFKGKQ
jgi:hypothetical protein